jgi:outer membrane protein OmpA-like peptidoglycan-associated protein
VNARRLPPGALAAIVAITAACAPKVVPPPAPPPLADVVVLVPDPDDARAGAVTVTTPQGSVELAAANESTRVASGQAPSAPAPMADDEIQRRFGGAMSARPLPPREFLLYFESGGDTLTAESLALVTDIVEAVRQRPAPDVSVIGHTDTTGEAAANIALGLQRATLIRDLLVTSGLDPSRVDVASHGETNLLVPTPDDTAEAKNRRVEVTVR